MAIIISEDGKNAKKLERSGFDGEGRLQEYVYDNPESIPLHDIKENVRLLIVAREFPTESGPIDALGFDSEGDIYCIETKLYKNPDKRTVVAQVLDYGSSLWHGYEDFSEFTNTLDDYLRKTHGLTLNMHVKDFFNLDDGGLQEVLENVRTNLSGGVFKFVVLMDTVHERLKELVVFLNQNSRFDIFAVEMEFYHYKDFEILIPKLFGSQVKKELGGSRAWSKRRKWNEEAFREDVRQRLDPKYQPAVLRLLDFSKTMADDLMWGTGTTHGSMNPRFSKIAQRSLFTLTSDGRLRLNLGWLGEGAVSPLLLERFKNEIGGIPGMSSLRRSSGYFETLLPDVWAPQVEAIIGTFQRLLSAD